jgi:hypothetical protein
MGELIRRYAVVGIVLFVITVVTIQNIFNARTAANDVMAQTILKKISLTLEDYRTKNGIYPSSLDQIVIEEKPYFLKNYFSGIHSGFNFQHKISDRDYTITATPVSRSNGSHSYTITTGGRLH